MGRPALSRRRKMYESKTFRAELQGDLAAVFDNLKKDVRESVLRPAVYAGAKVIYDGARQNVPVESGKLYGAIFHYYEEGNSSDTHKSYLIGPNKRQAPHWYNVEYGHWRYNKSINHKWMRSKSNPNRRGPAAHDIASGRLPSPIRVQAVPYMHDTWNSLKLEALEAMKLRFAQRLSEVIREGAK
jgi:hypothetical protein